MSILFLLQVKYTTFKKDSKKDLFNIKAFRLTACERCKERICKAGNFLKKEISTSRSRSLEYRRISQRQNRDLHPDKTLLINLNKVGKFERRNKTLLEKKSVSSDDGIKMLFPYLYFIGYYSREFMLQVISISGASDNGYAIDLVILSVYNL